MNCMKKILTMLMISLLTLTSIAQTGQISGIFKGGGLPVSGGTVTLLGKDSSEIRSASADKEGFFKFSNLPGGTYFIRLSAKGFVEKYSSLLAITDTSAVNIGIISTEPLAKNLQNVVVNSKRPLIEVKADKTILNVDGAISNTGTYALDVLEKAPGVSVDKDGNISLKGKQGVIILIDGKQTYLSGTELANYLRNIPASNLDQVEIMTNPSAKYDASGNAGLINIKTKKQKQKGFNGSVSSAYTQSIFYRFNNSLNLNYRVGKVNLFSTLSANVRKGRRKLEINRKYLSNSGELFAEFDQVSHDDRENENYNAKFGIDYLLTKRTTIGTSFTGYTVPSKKNGVNTSYLKNAFANVDSIVYSQSSENSGWKHLAANVNFRHQIDSGGQEISADLDYLRYKSHSEQDFRNDVYDPQWVKRYGDNLSGTLPGQIDIYTAKIDYAKPLARSLKFESGYKFSIVETDNIADYFSVIDGIKQSDYEKTNRFAYEEIIHAGYINFNKEWKKWSVQTGLRVETTEYSGHQYGNPMRSDSSFKSSYISAFPTVYIGYKPQKNHSFTMSYGRRINRPDYEDLNPFLFFIDKYTYDSGNPYLKPMYSDVAELSHTFKNWLTSTLNYTYTQDLFAELFEERGFATLLKNGNFGRSHNTSLSVNAMINVKRWWKANLYSEGRYLDFTGIVAGKAVKNHGGVYLFHLQNSFTFNKGWSAEVTGLYRSLAMEGQMRIRQIGRIDLGVQKQILKNKGSIKLNARDVLLTMIPRGNINFQNTRASFRQVNDSRGVTLSFQYKFGKPMKSMSKKKSGGASEEQSRVKTAS